MKKTYIQPSIQEVKIQATTILVGSEKLFSTPQSGNSALSKHVDYGEIEFED